MTQRYIAKHTAEQITLKHWLTWTLSETGAVARERRYSMRTPSACLFYLSRKRLNALCWYFMPGYGPTSVSFYPCYNRGTSTNALVSTSFLYLGSHRTCHVEIWCDVWPINYAFYMAWAENSCTQVQLHIIFKHICLLPLVHRPKAVLLVTAYGVWQIWVKNGIILPFCCLDFSLEKQCWCNCREYESWHVRRTIIGPHRKSNHGQTQLGVAWANEPPLLV